MSENYIYGLHAVKARLERANSGKMQGLGLYVQDAQSNKRVAEIVALAAVKGIAVSQVERAKLDELVSGAVHQGVVMKIDSHADESSGIGLDLESLLQRAGDQAFFLILDGVQDPHNLGACMRSADAVGVDAVIVPKDNAASLTGVVRKVACGAAEHTPLLAVSNLARTISILKDHGVWVYGATSNDDDGSDAEKTHKLKPVQSIFDLDLRPPLAIVLGAEGAGLRRLTAERCDFLMHIPMSPKSSVSSLNVSVATGICLFEVARKMR